MTPSLEGLDDTDKVFEAFASTCIKAGQNCSLNALYNFNNSAALVSKVDSTIDSLYSNPLPGYIGEPVVANAATLRQIIFSGSFFSVQWPELASVLGDVMQGNVTSLLALTTQRISDQLAGLPDGSPFAQNAIFVSFV